MFLNVWNIIYDKIQINTGKTSIVHYAHFKCLFYHSQIMAHTKSAIELHDLAFGYYFLMKLKSSVICTTWLRLHDTLDTEKSL